MRYSLSTWLASSVGLATAVALPPHQRLTARNTTASSCENTATSRSCWGDYSIDTNWYEETPTTGVTREYWLNVQNTTLSPDGVERYTLNFNGTIPGPTLIADWGDEIIVHVTNNLENNGTSIHWHGLRQLENSEYDGVPGVTQCPIAPGDSLTYKFQATQYGSTWYHSHYTLQYADGLFGGLIINGPATADYDEDLGTLTLSDWGHESAFALWDVAQQGAPPTLENGLINGTNVYGDLGSRYETVFESGTKYRIRLVNAATDAHFRFAIDNHNITVIAADLVPIVPYEADSVLLTMGQRYDIIVEANQDVGDYWMRAVWQTTCSANDNADNILGIVRYDSSSTSDPSTNSTGWTESCGDEDLSNLTPYLALDAQTNGTATNLDLSFDFSSVFTWTINNSSLYLNWSDPTTLAIKNNESIFPTDYNVFATPGTDDDWVLFIINDDSNVGLYHPIHLHGHDFYIIGQGNGEFSESTAVMNYSNPPRRDVATLPANGYLALAWKTDNPGSWIAHCHIAWHASEGLAVQFVERESEISGTITGSDASMFADTCSAWDEYYNGSELYPQDDSGI